MAQIEIPDNPNWRRFFVELKKLADQYPRIPKDTKVEMIGGEKGILSSVLPKHFTPDT